MIAQMPGCDASRLNSYKEVTHYLLLATQVFDDVQDLRKDSKHHGASHLIFLASSMGHTGYVDTMINVAQGLILKVLALEQPMLSHVSQTSMISQTAHQVNQVLRRFHATIESMRQRIATADSVKDLSVYQKANRFFETNVAPHGGHLTDFLTSRGLGSEWISGFCGYQLQRSERQEFTPMIGELASVLFTKQRADGGWGYNDAMCSDTDSTAWVSVFLASFDGPKALVPALHKSLGYLKQAGQNGKYSTYQKMQIDYLTETVGIKRESFAGWLAHHDCVTLAANLALQHIGIHTGETFPVPRFTLNSYWWLSKYYAIFLLSEGFPEQLTPQVIDLILQAQTQEGAWFDQHADENLASDFSSAMCTLILANTLTARGGMGWVAARKPAIENAINLAVKHLQKAQLPDGGWRGHAYLLIPDTDELVPDPASYRRGHQGNRVITHDLNRVFTSSLAIRALATADRPTG
jgi:Prenyltransferase and squalene oxidase repeat